ncbi:MAG: hypothetical protein GZ091_15265 [Paludibacter sp.]|nr:hypothetical protein [Paludibacter sp.]
MKPSIYILIGVISFMFSCNDNDTETSYNKTIDVTDYSLAGSSCTWKNVEKSTLYLIKSSDDFSNYLVCSGNDYPVIDFSKNSLLLVHGTNLSGIQSIERQLQQFEKDKYKLRISIVSNAATVVQSWTVAVLIPKVSDESVFTMEIAFQK